MLTSLEKALLSGETGGLSGWRGGCLLVNGGGGGGTGVIAIMEGFEGAAHLLKCYLGRLPLRAGEIICAAVRLHGDLETLSMVLLEVNRALVDGGLLVLTANLEDPARFLVKHGFALVSEQRPTNIEDATITLSRKAWRKYLSEACPRCGSRLVLPLIPPDANVRKVWTVYCPACSYNWSVEEPITEWI